jgi:hypothetical protein
MMCRACAQCSAGHCLASSCSRVPAAGRQAGQKYGRRLGIIVCGLTSAHEKGIGREQLGVGAGGGKREVGRDVRE